MGTARRAPVGRLRWWVVPLLAVNPTAVWCLDGLLPPPPDQVFAQIGVANAARSQVAGAAWGADWQAEWLGGRATLQWEATFGQWIGERDDGAGGTSATRTWATQVGLTPVLRWRPMGADGGWFVEGGIGANLILPSYRRQDKRFSTAFNFGDHLAVGWRFGERRQHELALRIQHFSNGGIRLPNPGENFRQLRYTLHL